MSSGREHNPRSFRRRPHLLDYLEPRLLLTITNVPSNGNLQTYINNANPGDTLVLPAGATYLGNFTLPNKVGTATITIQSSSLASLPSGVRVGPGQAALMPKILSNANGVPALATQTSAHDYQFLGIEFGTTSTAQSIGELISLGTAGTAQDTLAEVPTRLVFDRCYIHGWLNNTDEKRGIGLNSSDTTISNSYIAEIHSSSQDSQAIGGYNGPGNYTITNNYLEAAGENVLFGGADSTIPNLVPTNITITNNYFTKPLTWNQNDPSYAGVNYSIKNILELKCAANVLVDKNIFENNWIDAQVGFAIVFTPRNQSGGNTWNTVANVTFTNNIVRHSAGGINLLASDDLFPSLTAHDITFSNNLFYDIGGSEWGGNGNGFQIVKGGTLAASNITYEHNTMFATNTFLSFDSGQTANTNIITNFIYRNNMTSRATYGAHGPNGEGTVPFNSFTSGITITNGGSGYSIAPTITFTGGGGTGAAGTVTISGGVVKAILITNNGTGYTSAPTISFSTGAATATDTVINGKVTGWTFVKNAIIGSGSTSVYPTGNFFPANNAAVGFVDSANNVFTLTAASAYHNAATDGTDIGVNFPAVVSINRTNANPTAGPTVNFTVTFSASVTGVDITDFALANSGLTNPSIASVTGSGASYNVLVNTGTGSGSLGLNLVDNDSILNATGAPLAGLSVLGNFTGQTYTINSDTTAPKITAIYTRSSSWSSAFLNYLVTNNQGDATLGYKIPTGSAAQLQTLPWSNLNQLSITFSEAVNVAQAALTLTGLSATYPSSTFSYNATSHTATWNFTNPLPTDKFQIAIPSASVTDLANNALDGEWTDSTSTSSGNGTAGGNFQFHFNVLPGDINHDSIVDGFDFNIWFNNLETNTFDPTKGDLNADGIVDGFDFNIWFNHLEQSLAAPALDSPTSSPAITSPNSSLTTQTSAPLSSSQLLITNDQSITLSPTIAPAPIKTQNPKIKNPPPPTALTWHFHPSHATPQLTLLDPTA